MAKRPYVSFAEVKDKVPIPDVLAEFGVVERFYRKGDTLTGVCPLPSHQHGPNPNPQQFKIGRRDGVWLWHCFGDCQRGGDVVELVKGMTGYDDAHVRFWFAEKFGERLTLGKPKEQAAAQPERQIEKETAHEVSEESPQAVPVPPSKLSDELVPLKPLRFHLNLDPDVSYLRQRGLTREIVQRYGLGLCGKGVLKGYIAIPVHRWPGEPNENPVAYLGRWPSDEIEDETARPRYKWPEGFLKTRVLFGLREALAITAKPLIVVEGPLTVLYLAQHGMANAVATFGAAMSDEQAAILSSTGRSIILMLDGDDAGRVGMRTAAAKVITRTFVRAIKLPDNTKPDQFSAEELAAMLA